MTLRSFPLVIAASAGDAISNAAGTYTETVYIPISVTLTGAGAASTIVDGFQSGTVLTVNKGATVAVGGLTIQDGNESSYYGGGGIYNLGTLTLTNTTLARNSSCCNYSGGGGAIANYGTLTMTSSTVMSNSITGSPGAPGGGRTRATSASATWAPSSCRMASSHTGKDLSGSVKGYRNVSSG